MDKKSSETLQDLLNKRDLLTTVTGTDINRVVSEYNSLNVVTGTIIKVLQDEIETLTTPPKPVSSKEPEPKKSKSNK